METFQFARIPFGLLLTLQVFTKLTRVVTSCLAHRGVPTLMYIYNWLLHSSSKEGAPANSVLVTLKVLADMGFLVNMGKSITTPTQQLDWLGIHWNTSTTSLSLAPDNILRTIHHIRRVFLSRIFSRHQWDSLLGSLNFAAPVIPLGSLKHRHLTWVENHVVPLRRRNNQHHIPRQLHRLLRHWLHLGALANSVPWFPFPPSLTEATDASDAGWGFQSDKGHQTYWGWMEEMRVAHVNLRQLGWGRSGSATAWRSGGQCHCCAVPTEAGHCLLRCSPVRDCP